MSCLQSSPSAAVGGAFTSTVNGLEQISFDGSVQWYTSWTLVEVASVTDLRGIHHHPGKESASFSECEFQ